jgi:SAM-dependent methyltransferase
VTATATLPVPAAREAAAVMDPAGTGTSEGAHLELLLATGPVPLGYIREDDTIYLIARNRPPRWPVILLREGRAELRLRDQILTGRCELVTDPSAKREVLAKFLAGYGPGRFARWYDRPARILVVHLEPGGGTGSGDVPQYYDWLSAEFDNVADDYDHHITGNRINVLLRDRSLRNLRTLFREAPCLVEIGCGSGMETLPLLEEGHEILCVDISARMLDVVREKARRAGVQERLRTWQGRAGRLTDLLREVGPGVFDGGYSTYGALNCEEDLSPIPHALHELLRPDGRFVAGVYNRWCLFEILGYSISGQPSRAFGRTHRPVPVGSSRFCVDVYAHSVGDFDRLFRPYFTVERIEAVPVLLPPSDLVSYAERFSRHFDTLSRWDRALGTTWPFQFLGDHFLTTFRRREIRTPTARPGPLAHVTPA